MFYLLKSFDYVQFELTFTPVFQFQKVRKTSKKPVSDILDVGK